MRKDRSAGLVEVDVTFSEVEVGGRNADVFESVEAEGEVQDGCNRDDTSSQSCSSVTVKLNSFEVQVVDDCT